MATATKRIIQRALPLTEIYSLVKISYISILDGGCSCENCGRLIANIATVKDSTGISYDIGTDCLETLLINNKLLDSESYFNYMHSDKPALQKAKQLRTKILNGQKKDPSFSAAIYYCKDGLRYGFSYSVFIERKGYRDPAGFDFTFNMKYLEITLGYIKDLPNILLAVEEKV